MFKKILNHRFILFLKKVHKNLKRADVQLVEASLSYSSILAFIPLMAVIIAFLDIGFGLNSFVPKVESFILGYFKGSLGQDGILILHQILKKLNVKKMGGVSFLFLLFTVVRLVQDIDFGVHKIWNLKNQRKWWKKISVYVALLVLSPFFLVMEVLVVKSKNEFLRFFPKSIKAGILLFLLLISMNKYLPSTRVRWSHAAWGSLVSICCLSLVQIIFDNFTFYLFNYSKLYGGMAALPTLLVYLLLIWKSILLGVGVTATLKENEKSFQIKPSSMGPHFP